MTAKAGQINANQPRMSVFTKRNALRQPKVCAKRRQQCHSGQSPILWHGTPVDCRFGPMLRNSTLEKGALPENLWVS